MGSPPRTRFAAPDAPGAAGAAPRAPDSNETPWTTHPRSDGARPPGHPCRPGTAPGGPDADTQTRLPESPCPHRGRALAETGTGPIVDQPTYARRYDARRRRAAVDR